MVTFVEEEVEELLLTVNCQDKHSVKLIFIITRTHRKENHQKNWKPSTSVPDCLATLPLFVFTLDFP